MVKNNLKALIVHILMSIMCIAVYIIFNSSTPKWVSEEAATRHHYEMVQISLIVIIISLLLYYFVSRKFCSNQRSVLANIASVSLVSILGIFLWVIAFGIDLTGSSGRLLNSELWVNYCSYNGYSMFLFDELEVNNPYIFLIASFIPTIIMGLGIKRK